MNSNISNSYRTVSIYVTPVSDDYGRTVEYDPSKPVACIGVYSRGTASDGTVTVPLEELGQYCTAHRLCGPFPVRQKLEERPERLERLVRGLQEFLTSYNYRDLQEKEANDELQNQQN